MKSRLPKVAIVGRANVGKSHLFNRLVEKHKALVSPIAGTTRDRNIDLITWGDAYFELTDTGGIDIDPREATEIDEGIIRQAQGAITEADLILFVIDVKDGLMPGDREIARQLLRGGHKAKTLLVGNKADSIKLRQGGDALLRLGLGEPQFVSAANGSGTGDLLDLMAERLPRSRRAQPEPSSTEPIKIAIVGKPNVGKSSLLNAVLGEERVIVSDIAHTTREAHDTTFTYKGRDFILIDTAGIRKQAKIGSRGLERQSVDKSLAAIAEADVVLLVTDASRKLDTQDKKISQYILEQSKSVIIIANKWDLIPDKETNTVNEYQKYYYQHFDYLWWAPLIFISAYERQRTHKTLDLVMTIWEARHKHVTDSQLDRLLERTIKQHRPSRGKGLRNPFIYTIRQTATNPPRFEIAVNDPEILHFSYIRFLQNSLREEFSIVGTPIQIEAVKRKRDPK